MNRTTIENRVLAAFNEMFEDCQEITLDTTKDTIEDWDSIAQIKLVLILEGDFGLRLSMDEVSNIKTPRGFVEAIAKRIGG